MKFFVKIKLYLKICAIIESAKTKIQGGFMKKQRILFSLLCLFTCIIMLSSCGLLFAPSFPSDSSSNSGFNTNTDTSTNNFIPDTDTLEGVSLSSAYINSKGELILVYTNGNEQNLGVVVGKDGNIDVSFESTGTSVAYATSKAIKSAVSISCNYTSGSGLSASTYGSSGSGVIYKVSNGKAFIITNYHVVYDANCNTSNHISNDIKVYLYGAEYSDHAIKAQYVGGSAQYDIAVIYIDASAISNGAYGPCEVADSNKVYVGDTAIAVGNPEGTGISATSGVVSVDSETITVDIKSDGVGVELRVMRIDTAVNPGNSGGGLFDNTGRLIGIVNAKTGDEEIEGIGYAIPSNIAVNVADNIIDYCYGTSKEAVYKAMLGITITINETKAVTNSEGRVEIEEEVYVTNVDSSGIAYGKIQVNDVIKSVRIGDRELEVTRQFQIIDFMLSARVGDIVYTTVERGGQEITVQIEITNNCLTKQ